MANLLLIGASVRSAARSARRAGFAVWALDHFADDDLAQIAHVERVRGDYADVLSRAARLPGGAWMYTGAVENHGELIDSLAGQRSLLGNPVEVIRAVRDPWRLSRKVQDAGFQFPQLRATAPRPGADWLCKSSRSCAGLQVASWNAPHAVDAVRAPRYWQRLIGGQARGAQYLSSRGECRCLGICEQLSGDAWSAPRPFQFAGSLLPARTEVSPAEYARLGTVLADTFGLRGLFGVDVVEYDGQLWVLEVNPRFTASMELLEWAWGVNLVSLHVAACQHDGRPDLLGLLDPVRDSAGKTWGKLIVYATEPVQVGRTARYWIQQRNQAFPDTHTSGRWPTVADFPAEGTAVPAGGPIATVLESGVSPRETIAKLQRASRELRNACDVLPDRPIEA